MKKRIDGFACIGIGHHIICIFTTFPLSPTRLLPFQLSPPLIQLLDSITLALLRQCRLDPLPRSTLPLLSTFLGLFPISNLSRQPPMRLISHR